MFCLHNRCFQQVRYAQLSCACRIFLLKVQSIDHVPALICFQPVRQVNRLPCATVTTRSTARTLLLFSAKGHLNAEARHSLEPHTASSDSASLSRQIFHLPCIQFDISISETKLVLLRKFQINDLKLIWDKNLFKALCKYPNKMIIYICS